MTSDIAFDDNKELALQVKTMRRLEKNIDWDIVKHYTESYINSNKKKSIFKWIEDIERILCLDYRYVDVYPHEPYHVDLETYGNKGFTAYLLYEIILELEIDYYRAFLKVSRMNKDIFGYITIIIEVKDYHIAKMGFDGIDTYTY